MVHCTDGVLRRYLDEPAAVSHADRAHLSACARCTAELEQARRNRDAVAALLSPAGPGDRAVAGAEPDVDAAWAELRERLADPVPAGAGSGWAPATARSRTGAMPRTGRVVDRVLRRPVAVVATAGVVLLGGTAVAAAADLIPIFRTEKVSAVAVSEQDARALDQLSRLAELSAFGEMDAPKNVEPVQVADAGAAQSRTGLAVPRVASLPTGVSGTPDYFVIAQQTVQVTFSAAKMQQAATSAGVTPPPMPSGLDGTRLQVQGGPGLAEVWQQKSGTPTLVVARAKALTATSEGASLPVVRDYLLAMPGLSPALRDQLRTLTGDGTTLPIPIPQGQATSSRADVGGVPATVLETKGQAMAAVVWVRDGVLNVVAGPLDDREVLAVARGLH
jgi:hypothetical protein